jgi:Fe-S cluster assembly protein SufD
MNVEIKPPRTAAEQGIADNFAAAQARLPGGAEVVRLRERAFQSFAETGLPHRRIEEWKYTDLRSLLREAVPLAGPAEASACARLGGTDPLGGVELRRLVFVNGQFSPELSDLTFGRWPRARHTSSSRSIASRLTCMPSSKSASAPPLTTAAR